MRSNQSTQRRKPIPAVTNSVTRPAYAEARSHLGVERLDLGGVFLGDWLALQLHRRRQLVAAGQPVRLDDPEPLDLLDPAQMRVRLLDRALDLGLNLLVRRQRRG